MSSYAKQADTAAKVASILGSVNSQKQFKVARNIIARFIKTQPDKSLRDMVRKSYKDALLDMPGSDAPRALYELAVLEL